MQADGHEDKTEKGTIQKTIYNITTEQYNNRVT